MTTSNKKAFDDTFVNDEGNIVVNTAYKTVLAGVGAVAMIQDETSSLIGRLIERGERVELKGREQIREVADMPKGQVEKVSNQVNGQVNKGVDSILGWFNIPTKSDVKALNTRIATLTKKVDKLNKSQASA